MANGVYKARKPTLNQKQLAKVRKMIAAGTAKVEVARQFGISRAALYAYLNKLEG